MSGTEEEWVRAAMSEDMMVVELLVRLHATAPSPPPLKPPALPLEWSVRQRRSKPASASGSAKTQSQRASPTTPLSWSGATSLSGGSGGGGEEESSRPTAEKFSLTPGSKVNGDSDRTSLKRTRKKTLAELRDAESTLLKERRDLKRELAALRLNLDKQRTTNKNLKRMKIELQPFPDTETTIFDQLNHTATTDDPALSDNAVRLQLLTSDCCPGPDPIASSDPKFVLPDLNMPFEEDYPFS
ncbi:hypothetical protein OROHE_005743 [Orobanche hederae]